MTPFEEELRSALQPKDPPPGFADRVAELRQARARTARGWPRRAWAAAAIAAMVVAGFAGAAEYRRRQEEDAGRKALLGLRIAAEKLNRTRHMAVDRVDFERINQ